ncbi:unnamed protein product [Calypogeia fissa]
MAMGLDVSKEFSLVGLVVAAAVVANLYMMFGVVGARKKYGVHYPTLYALETDNKEAKIFNCVQRGHQNYLEIVPFFFAALLVAGLQHPRIATAAGILFVVARIIYFNDYSTGVPKKRERGAALGYMCVMVLIVCCISFTVHQLFF